MRRTIFLLLGLLLPLSGCVEMSPEERLLCLELTSYSQTEVPRCTSQEECFSFVESDLNLGIGLLDGEAQASLHDYKNRIARSWLYYNRAMENLHEIHGICGSASNYSALPREANELNKNLVEAFSEIDLAFRDSVSVMALESSALAEHDINLVKEEPLFQDYAEMMHNLNELSQNSYEKNSSSYTSTHFRNLAEFNSLFLGYGFRPLSLNEFSFLQFARGKAKALEKHVPKEHFYIPLIAKTIVGAAGYLADAASLENSAEALKHFPSFEMLNSYNRFIGVKSSSAKIFSGLMGRAASNLGAIEARNAEIEAEIANEIAVIGSLLASLESAAPEIENSSPAEGTSVIRASPFAESTLEETISGSKSRAEKIESSLSKLAQEFPKTTFGKRANSLKELRLEAGELRAFLEGLDSTLRQELAGRKTYANVLSQPAEACPEKLELAFSSRLMEESPLLERYARFKASFAEDINSACLSLLSQVEEELLSKQAVQTLVSNHKESKELHNALSRIISQTGKTPPGFAEAEKKFKEESAFFREETLDIFSALPGLESLSLKSTELSRSFRQLLAGAISAYLEASVETYSESSEIPYANRLHASTIIVLMENPFREVDSPASILLKIPEGAELADSPPFIKGITRNGKKITLLLERIPLGVFRISFTYKGIVANAETKTELMEANPSTALFKALVKINPLTSLDYLNIEVPLEMPGRIMQGTTAVSREGKKPSFATNGNSLTITLAEVRGEEELTAHYSVSSPLSIGASLKSQEQIDSNTARYIYEISLANNLDREIKTTSVLVPLPPIPSLKKDALLFSGQGEKAAFSETDEGISISPVSMLPLQEKKYSYSFTVKDYSSYWSVVLSSLCSRLEALSASPHSDVSEAAKNLLADAGKLGAGEFHSREKAPEISSFLGRAHSLEQKDSILSRQSLSYSDALKDVEGKASELMGSADRMENEGLDGLASSLRSAAESALSKVKGAETSAGKEDYNTALLLLGDAERLLSVGDQNLSETIASGANLLVEGINKTASLLASAGISDSSLMELRSLAFSTSRELTGFIATNNPASAKKSLDSLEKTAAKFESLAITALQGKARSLSGKVASFEQLVTEKIPLLLETLLSQRNSLPPEEGDGLAETFLPKSWLSNREDELDEIKIPDSELEELSNALAANDFSRISKFSVLEKSLGKALRLEDALQKKKSLVEGEAKDSFNSAVRSYNLAPENVDAKFLLAEAKTAYDAGSYLGAIFYSRKAAGLLGAGEANPGFPLAIIPLLGIAGVAAYSFHKKKTKPKPRYTRIQRRLL